MRCVFFRFWEKKKLSVGIYCVTQQHCEQPLVSSPCQGSCIWCICMWMKYDTVIVLMNENSCKNAVLPWEYFPLQQQNNNNIIISFNAKFIIVIFYTTQFHTQMCSAALESSSISQLIWLDRPVHTLMHTCMKRLKNCAKYAFSYYDNCWYFHILLHETSKWIYFWVLLLPF